MKSSLADPVGCQVLGIRQLKVLIAIADERSLTRAAERLNTSQPWISEQLRQIEETLDISLVSRTRGKFLNLTSAGESIAAIARRVVGAYDEGRVELESLCVRDRSKLVLGAETITMEMAPRNQLLLDFMDASPKVELQVENASHAELFAGLRSGRFDLILALRPSPDPDFEVLDLYEHEIKAFLPNATASQPPFDRMERLSDTTVLTLPEAYHPEFMAWLGKAVEPASFKWRICPEANFEALLRHAVHAGVPALMPDLSVWFPDLMKKLTVRPLNVGEPLVAHWALMRLPGYHPRANETFWTLAQARKRGAEGAAGQEG